MVERVAKVISRHLGVEPSPNWDEVARETIKAMREPTQGVLDAGPPEPYMDKDVWAKMIDAALALTDS